MMEGRYPDIPAELTRLVASTTLYCRYPRRTEREIYEGMGLEPGVWWEPVGIAREVDTVLLAWRAAKQSADATGRDVEVKRD